jgi:hypothetical protein
MNDGGKVAAAKPLCNEVTYTDRPGALTIAAPGGSGGARAHLEYPCNWLRLRRPLKNLVDATKKEKKMEYAHFAEKLMLHAPMDEEILYPAAILIDEYLKMKLNR